MQQIRWWHNKQRIAQMQLDGCIVTHKYFYLLKNVVSKNLKMIHIGGYLECPYATKPFKYLSIISFISTSTKK